jgi:16S rRNA (uracil1498-N3)-methyltransferase
MNVFIAAIEGRHAVLTPEESWHCAKVLRFKAGEPVRLIDGQGHAFDAKLSLVTEKRCEAQITAGPFTQRSRGYHLHLAIAPTKQIDRMEWMLEKAVEIGIDEVTFLQCKNSGRTVIRVDRMQKIAESAVKQSLQALIPQVHELTAFEKFVNRISADNKLIAHCNEGSKLSIRDIQFRDRRTVVMIGPEGDFTAEEVALAVKAGFKGVSLGESRLRTETAGLYLVQAASFF